MATYHVREDGRGGHVGDYWPLIALVGTAALAGGAYATALGGGAMVWMHGFMGVFLLIFAVLKIFDLKGFRRGFKMYDILAKHVEEHKCLRRAATHRRSRACSRRKRFVGLVRYRTWKNTSRKHRAGTHQ